MNRIKPLKRSPIVWLLATLLLLLPSSSALFAEGEDETYEQEIEVGVLSSSDSDEAFDSGEIDALLDGEDVQEESEADEQVDAELSEEFSDEELDQFVNEDSTGDEEIEDFDDADLIGSDEDFTDRELQTSETDLQGDEEDLDLTSTVDGMDEEALGEEAFDGSDALEDEAIASLQPASNATSVPSGIVGVTSLDFKMVGKRSQIRMGFSQKPIYRIQNNPAVRQTILFFQNVQAPEKLQRAYDTREFSSPVALFTLLQLPQGGSKLIVQMREFMPPSVKWVDGQLVAEFAAPSQVYSSQKLIPNKSGLANKASSYNEENIYAADTVFTGKRISRLEIKDSDIQDVLRLIAKTSGYNLVVGEDVKGTVGTLSLNDIPWDQAFTLVLQTKKLGYVRQGNVLRVATLATLKSEKEAAIANEASKVRVEKLRTVLIPISYADSKELAARAKPFLSARGKIDTDARTNTVIVRDIASVTNRVRKLVSALDTQPPRVAISAKIVEMVDTFSRQLGFSNIQNSGSIDGINIENSFSTTLGAANSTSISSSKLANLNAVFKLGQLENKVEILANPHITAVNNQKANVTQSITQFLPESVIAGGATTQTFREIKANLSLDVTPIVSGDGSIFMRVVVTNEVPTGPPERKQIDTRSISTQVLVENGDTAVIGGIYNSTQTSAMQGLPWLMKVPILGFFVSNRSREENRNEILVFLTPKILNADESFKQKLG